MQIAYIVAQKIAKKRCFSLKTARIVKKHAFFGENRAKSAVFSGFWREILADSENMRNQLIFSKSSLKKFENYWIRGRVILYITLIWAAHSSPENKKPLSFARAAVSKI